MKTKREAIDFCLKYQNVYEDYPFGDYEWAVMRHVNNKKSFAMIFMREGKAWINVKVDDLRFILTEQYSAVIPAYHMNKEHWVSIILDGTMTDDEISALVSISYDITKPKKRT